MRYFGVEMERVQLPTRWSVKRIRRRGAATVEFAVVCPLFLMLLAGIVEIGQATRVNHMLSTVSRRGARSASMSGASSSVIASRVKTQLSKMCGLKEQDIIVTVAVAGDKAKDLSSANKGDEIEVSVRVPYSKAGMGVYANLFSTMDLKANCFFEHE
jgi:Flp pilus assembly protein TadG